MTPTTPVQLTTLREGHLIVL